MVAVSNLSTIAAGIEAVRSGFEKAEFGAVKVAVGVIESWSTPLRWSYGKGDNAVSGMFSLSEMFIPVISENGKADNKAASAKYDAVGEAFGINWGATAQMQSQLKMMFLRGWRIGAAKFADVDLRIEDGGKVASVPVSVAFDLVDDDGKATTLGEEVVQRIKVNAEMEGKTLTDAEVSKRLAAMRIACRGGKHPVFGDVPSASSLAGRLVPYLVNAGLMPAPVKRSGRTGDKGATFLTSLDFVAECMATLGTAEPDVALTNDGEAKLRAVAEAIAAYFANK